LQNFIKYNDGAFGSLNKKFFLLQNYKLASFKHFGTNVLQTLKKVPTKSVSDWFILDCFIIVVIIAYTHKKITWLFQQYSGKADDQILDNS
jgi:hypothetical protein